MLNSNHDSSPKEGNPCQTEPEPLNEKGDNKEEDDDEDDDIVYPDLDDEEVNIEEYIFDYDFYYDKYPDVRLECPHNRARLYQHWKNIGIRKGYACSPVLDISFYYREHLSMNPDISFGIAYQHFLKVGIQRRLASSQWYNPDAYCRRYPKLKRYNPRQLMMHYISIGRFREMLASE